MLEEVLEVHGLESPKCNVLRVGSCGSDSEARALARVPRGSPCIYPV